MKYDNLQAGRRFLAWMEKKYPGSADKILVRAGTPRAASQLGQFPGIPPLPTASGTPTWPQTAVLQPTAVPQPTQPEPAWWEKLADAASSVAKGYLSYKQQDKLTDLQIERMKRGLPPIEDPGRYMAPTVKVAHTVDPSSFTPSKETQQMLWIGGGLIGLVLLMALNR